MTSLASFSKTLCTTCNEVTLHDGVGCIHCRTSAVVPVARDIGALTYSGQPWAAVAARLERTGALSKARALPVPETKPRRPYGTRPATLKREAQILAMIDRGVTSQAAIARVLGMSPQGVGFAIRRARDRGARA